MRWCFVAERYCNLLMQEMNAEEVYQAASLGQLQTLQLGLKSLVGVDLKHAVEQRSGQGSTPLIAAILNRHSPVVFWLVKTCKADVEQV